MKTASITLFAAAAAFALAACDSVDDRTTSAEHGADRTAALQGPPVVLSAPVAEPDRTPPAPTANATAPGIDAAEALADKPAADAAEASGATAGGAASGGKTGTDGDAADDEVMTDAEAAKVMGTTETARDTHLNNPRHGELTKEEEVKALPKAGQVNNHSSTALEKDSGR
jgi:hypothetical protein